jgi:hypothetical protein
LWYTYRRENAASTEKKVIETMIEIVKQADAKIRTRSGKDDEKKRRRRDEGEVQEKNRAREKRRSVDEATAKTGPGT